MKRFLVLSAILAFAGTAQAQQHLGIFKRGEIVPVIFPTYDVTNGASITMTGLAVTDIEIYKRGSITQRASDSGYVLIDTDGMDIDATTGLHGFTIDTADDTTAGFWEPGGSYTVVVNSITVNTQTVVGVWTFQLDSRVVTFGTAAAGTATTIDLAGSFADDFLKNHVIQLLAGTGAGQSRLCTGWTDANNRCTVSEAWTTNPDSTTVYAVLASNQGFIQAQNGIADVHVKSFDPNALDGDAADTTFVTKVQSGLATPTSARDAIMDYVLDNGITYEQAACHMLSVLAGEAAFTAGSPDQSVFSDPTGTDVRVTVQYGSDNGDRTSVTLDATNCGS